MSFEETKNYADAISKLLEQSVKVLGERPDKFPKLLKKLKSVGLWFPYAGIILSMVEPFLYDENHEEIMKAFKDLHRSIKDVRDDIKELQTEIKWETTTLSYQACVSRIELAMEYVYEIGNSGHDEEKRRRNQKRLLEINQTQELTLALRMLLDGITGENDFFKKQILENFYVKSKGDRPKLTLLSARLLQLVIGGLMSLMTWEALENGPDGPRVLQGTYEKRLEDVVLVIQSLLDRCVKEAETNMKRDLDNIVASNSSESIVETVSQFLTQKYTCFHFRCFVVSNGNEWGKIPVSTNGSQLELCQRGEHVMIHYYKKGSTSTELDKGYMEWKIENLCREEQSSWRFTYIRDIIGTWGIFYLPLLLILPVGSLARMRVASRVRTLLEKSNIKWWTLLSIDSVPFPVDLKSALFDRTKDFFQFHKIIGSKHGPDDKVILAGTPDRGFIIYLL